ncbi:valine--tRNA ligase [Oenococcus alcoholitolerans]|uniref:valine--tRNA ligase n=1 Tax=Oenococcus alcoholitolerans TaxID=931074 RepID=UPI003F727005
MREINMSTKYDPQEVEQGAYEKWQKAEIFNPDVDRKINPKKYVDQQPESYSIVIPPPNVTGKLHLGHAWDSTLQDILIRQKRMQGYDTLWLPGMDHAGIATQAKVEARLAQDGISRYDLGREAFVDKVWQWKDEYASIIKSQWEQMGLSLDFSRERFTLDKGLNQAVRKVFVDLYNRGLIYRGEYIINWDPKARTALSDIEVVHKDDKGAFYHVKYFFSDQDYYFNGKNYIEIATTRPETMFGDTAVAVNPSDDRYKELVGKKVVVPLVDREIEIIADPYVDIDFGTGMVKITPAHDPNDFKVGNRHDLPRINTMNEDASLNENAGKYQGLDRFKARKEIVKDLQEQGYMLKIEPIVHSVGHSERTDVQVEARLSTQWFVKMKPLAQQALAMQKIPEEHVDFWPKRFEETYQQWMENVHDWVISRQLWWGHRIPAWYKKDSSGKEETYVGLTAPKGEGWQQDSDVLDTWFSSALWPFSTLGWPDQNASDFKRFYPTSTMISGYDLIFFWISRMIFQGRQFTKTRPFKDVLLHGLIRDSQGRKMSKSLGNGIDPRDVIKKYGADALRWFLATGSTLGQDLNFSYDKMDASWNFINKIWNVSRYVLMNLEADTKPVFPDLKNLTLADKWILSRLNKAVGSVTENTKKFEFSEIGRQLYNFLWSDFADWYIEMTKETLNGDDQEAKRASQQVLAYVLDQTLKLLHPIIPFVTDRIWQQFAKSKVEPSLTLADYPVVVEKLNDPHAEEAFSALRELIVAIRNIRAEAKAPISMAVDIIVKIDRPELKNIFEDNLDYIERFTHPKSFIVSQSPAIPTLSMSQTITGATVHIPLSDLVDIDQEIERLNKETDHFQSEVKRSMKKLSSEKFIAKAPSQVVEKERAKLTDWQAKLDATKQRVEELKKNRD